MFSGEWNTGAQSPRCQRTSPVNRLLFRNLTFDVSEGASSSRARLDAFVVEHVRAADPAVKPRSMKPVKSTLSGRFTSVCCGRGGGIPALRQRASNRELRHRDERWSWASQCGIFEQTLPGWSGRTHQVCRMRNPCEETSNSRSHGKRRHHNLRTAQILEVDGGEIFEQLEGSQCVCCHGHIGAAFLRTDAVYDSCLEFHENRIRHVAVASGLIALHVDVLQLEV